MATLPNLPKGYMCECGRFCRFSEIDTEVQAVMEENEQWLKNNVDEEEE
jgi:hypothetical protein